MQDGQVSEWDFHVVDSEGDVGMFTSLALDDNNYPLISYFDNTNDNLKLVAWNGTSWDIEIIAPCYSRMSSLQINSYGYPVVAYFDRTVGKVLLSTKNDLGWFTQEVYSTTHSNHFGN